MSSQHQTSRGQLFSVPFKVPSKPFLRHPSDVTYRHPQDTTTDSYFSQIKIYNWNLGPKITQFEMTLEHLLKLEQNPMKCIKQLLLPVFTKQEPENEDIRALKCLKIKCQHRSHCLNYNTS